MRVAKKSIRVGLLFSILALLVMFSVGFCLGKFLPKKVKPEPEPEIDPHEGQVYINDGYEDLWYTPWEGAEASVLTREDFTVTENGLLRYVGEDYVVRRGVDVSDFQGKIDWEKVRDSGIDFAFIRIGYRGYGKGTLKEDDRYKENLEGAIAAGLDVGVYMFSQAITVEEAIEEANFVLDRIDGYRLTLPVVFDWESYTLDDSRTSGIDKTFLCKAAQRFCETIENGGYKAGVYFYRMLGYYTYDLGKLSDYMLWVSDPGEFTDFYYEVDAWQYSINAEVPGIGIITDLNLLFEKKDIS